MKGTIRIYGLGGAGTNLAKSFYNLKPTDGFADIKTCFVDTSLSNVVSKGVIDVNEDDVFALEGLDGSGKLRAANSSAIVENAKQILHKFKPEDVNILVSSASGGF